MSDISETPERSNANETGLMAPTARLRLTQTVKKGGCAAKVAAVELRRILGAVQFPPKPANLIVDGRHFDDAAIYRIDGPTAMVQTIDFFTPILDSPLHFGRVAAANALSDVYAMGGRPVMALAVLAVPMMDLPIEVTAEVLEGACQILTRAGCALAGGHSIDDETLKFGLSVTGLVNPEAVWTNAGAREGDILILTKPLGTGTLTAALKRGALSETEIAEAVESMSLLNNAIDWLEPAGLTSSIHAATDVTGFGLSGHAQQMARASQKNFEISLRSLPRFKNAIWCLEQNHVTKAHRTNREYTAGTVHISDQSPTQELLELLVHDPQTSGGLLLAVDPGRAAEVISVLKSNFPATVQNGRVTGGDGQVFIA